MKALVLGGNGFIGSHLIDRLLAAGHQVRVLDRGPEKFRAPLQGVDYRPGDFSDTVLLAEALSGIDVVFHFVSTTVPATSNIDPVADIESNLIGTVRLIELMRAQGVDRIVYLSSGGTVYGVPEVPRIPEIHPLRPICSYGIIKVTVEKYLHMAHHLHGLRYLVLRPSNPYGPRQGHAGVQGVIGTFLWKLAKGEPIEIWGDGSVVRDFIYVVDLVALCVSMAESEMIGIFNAGSGVGYAVTEVVERMRLATGIAIEPRFKPGRPYDVPHSVLDISAVRAAAGWQPAVSLEEGLRETWRWVREQI